MTTKQTTKSNTQPQGFRVILRGTTPKGKRVRHVITTPAGDPGTAMQAAEKRAVSKINGEKLGDVYLSVLPPLVRVN